MRYKIEIWQWYNITATYESNDIEDILSWYKSNWHYCYDMGDCAFDIYEDGRLLDFEEENELGFHF